MTIEDVQNRLLKISYQAHQSGGHVDLRSWAADEDIEAQKAHQCLDLLDGKKLMESFAPGSVGISMPGILFMEDNRLAPAELIRRNRQTRFKILDALASVREEKGMNWWPQYQYVIERSGVDSDDFRANEDVLCDLGFIEWPAMQLLRLTERGMVQAQTWRSQIKPFEHYQELQEQKVPAPQARGHELELLLRDVLISEGWKAESNIRSSGEEHDLILHRQLEYYIMECKWVKEATQPYLLSILRDRVTARIGMRGLFVSMSGFTPEAIKDTADRLEMAMILLFGQGDIEAIVSQHSQFSDLLRDKFHAAITRKAILIDGKCHTR